MKRYSIGLVLSASIVLSATVGAYELLLDIDLDDDPTTINKATTEYEAAVRLVIRPTEPGEIISFVEAPFGTRCAFCDFHGVWFSGGSIDWDGEPPDEPFDWASIKTIPTECSGPEHVNTYLYAEAEPFVLDEPQFVAGLNAFGSWSGGICPAPPSLISVFSPNGFEHTIELGTLPVPVDVSSWSQIKARF